MVKEEQLEVRVIEQLVEGLEKKIVKRIKEIRDKSGKGNEESKS